MNCPECGATTAPSHQASRCSDCDESKRAAQASKKNDPLAAYLILMSVVFLLAMIVALHGY